MNDVEKTIELISAGSDIAGALAGASIGLVVAGPAGALGGAAVGEVVGKTLTKVGGAIYDCWLGPRERVRIGAAAAYAIDRIRKNQESGRQLRSDDFFARGSGKRPAAEEILEGVLLKAKNTHQELKVPYIGYMYGNSAFTTEVDEALANQVLWLAEQLTYRQLCAMALFSDAGRVAGLASKFYEPSAVSLKQGSLVQEVIQMFSMGLLRSVDGSTMLEYLTPSGVCHTPLGKVVYELMGLDELPSFAVAAVEELLK